MAEPNAPAQTDPLDGFTPEELSAIVHDENASGPERIAARQKLNQISAQAGKERADELKKISDPKERKILQLYNKGVQNFEIAKQVYDGMVNSDTVGKVVLVIRKHHAEDFSEVEDVDSTRGYTGVSGGTSGQII